MIEGNKHRVLTVVLAGLFAWPSVAATAGPKPPAALKVGAHPGPARVFLDGDDLGLAPLEIPQRDTMLHQIKIEAALSRPWTLSVKFNPRTERSIDASLQPKEAVLIVVTDPPGADITVNDSAAGRSPQILPRQPAGPYRLSAGLKGYHTAETTMVLDEERTYSWAPVLVPKKGTISFSGWPSQAEVVYNDRPIGSMPMVWENVKQGTYAFEIRRPGFEPAILRTYVAPDFPGSIIVRLRPTRTATAIMKSLLIPGSGQNYRGYQSKGLLFKGLWFVSAATFAAAFNDRVTRYARYNQSVDRYRFARDSYDEYYQDAQDAWAVAHRANRRVNIVLAVAAVIYGINVVDAAVFAPNRDQFNANRDQPHAP